MKITSTLNCHMDECRGPQRQAIINNLIFNLHEPIDNLPTAKGVSEAEVMLFIGIPGYRIYHDDGTFVRDSSTETLKVADTPPIDQDFTELIRLGILTEEQVRAMGGKLPTLTKPEGETPQETQKDTPTPEPQQTPPTPEPTPQPDYSAFTRDQLCDVLKSKGIPFGNKDTKAELLIKLGGQA